MIRRRYVVTCDVCNRTPHGVTMYQQTSAEARRDARLAGWQRIPRGDARDRSADGRGMDLCRSHVDWSRPQ